MITIAVLLLALVLVPIVAAVVADRREGGAEAGSAIWSTVGRAAAGFLGGVILFLVVVSVGSDDIVTRDGVARDGAASPFASLNRVVLHFTSGSGHIDGARGTYYYVPATSSWASGFAVVGGCVLIGTLLGVRGSRRAECGAVRG